MVGPGGPHRTNLINGLRCQPDPNRTIEIKRVSARLSNPTTGPNSGAVGDRPSRIEELQEQINERLMRMTGP